MRLLGAFSRRIAAAVLAATLAAATLLPGVALATEPEFGEPSVTTALGEPLVFSSRITGDDVAAVEVLVRLDGEETAIVVDAEPGTLPGTYQATAELNIAVSALCACLAPGSSPPNTRFSYQFRVRAADGNTTVGPIGQAVVSDTRFSWQTLEQGLVRVHWYEGDQAFAQAAAQVANDAIDKASGLLGTTLPDPVDLFIYATEEDMRSATSPNRENVQAQAHDSIDTAFAWIPAEAVAAEFAGTAVAHELTHLVMYEATANPYHGTPRWLSEGVAVYLAEGYSALYRSAVDTAVGNRSLIPLDGLAGFFPSEYDQFLLAYGESVSAVDFFIRTYGEPTLWDLVSSYAEGVSDDDAFIAATGADVAAFNAAWFASLNVQVPDPVGPQPGAPGPTPSAWQEVPGQATAPPTADPGASGAPTPSSGTTAEPGTTPPPTGTPANPGDPPQAPTANPVGAVAIGLIAGVALLIGLILIVVLYQRSRAPRPPYG